RTLGMRGEIAGIATANVIAPPPTVERGSGSRGGGELIALNADAAAPSVPIPTPAGNRRGTFAAGPGGRGAGSGGAGLKGNANSGAGQNSGTANATLPGGLYVGKGPTSSAVAGHGQGSGSGGAFAMPQSGVLASAIPPRVSATKDDGAEPVPPELTMPV